MKAVVQLVGEPLRQVLFCVFGQVALYLDIDCKNEGFAILIVAGNGTGEKARDQRQQQQCKGRKR